jgi:multicomponent Na+:H+ antiporter subunit E
MSPQLKTRRDGQVRPARYRSLQLPMLVWLTLVWMVLWSDFSLITAVYGFLVATVACLVFPLPPLRLDTRLRPLPMLWLLVRFASDVVVSSVQVSWVVLRPGPPLRNAVIEVNLRTPSDFVMTVVAEMTCLIPGSLVVEARRSTHTLFLHVLDVRDEAGVERFRQSVLDQEARLVRAIGGHVEHLDDPAPTRGAAG